MFKPFINYTKFSQGAKESDILNKSKKKKKHNRNEIDVLIKVVRAKLTSTREGGKIRGGGNKESIS